MGSQRFVHNRANSTLWASLVAQLVKNPPAMQETWVRSLGWEDPLGKGKGYPRQYSGLENSIGLFFSQIRSLLSVVAGLL